MAGKATNTLNQSLQINVFVKQQGALVDLRCRLAKICTAQYKNNSEFATIY
jgi:hypothetical protein